MGRPSLSPSPLLPTAGLESSRATRLDRRRGAATGGSSCPTTGRPMRRSRWSSGSPSPDDHPDRRSPKPRTLGGHPQLRGCPPRAAATSSPWPIRTTCGNPASWPSSSGASEAPRPRTCTATGRRSTHDRDRQGRPCGGPVGLGEASEQIARVAVSSCNSKWNFVTGATIRVRRDLLGAVLPSRARASGLDRPRRRTRRAPRHCQSRSCAIASRGQCPGVPPDRVREALRETTRWRRNTTQWASTSRPCFDCELGPLQTPWPASKASLHISRLEAGLRAPLPRALAIVRSSAAGGLPPLFPTGASQRRYDPSSAVRRATGSRLAVAMDPVPPARRLIRASP